MTTYVVYLSSPSDSSYEEVGRFRSLALARRAARNAALIDEATVKCGAPAFAAADGGGYWHPDEVAIEAYCDRDGDEDAPIAWIQT